MITPESIVVAPGEARGWGMIITYFYLIYFAVLLIHRERRDEEKCKRKYDADWEEYRKRVPSRIVPFIRIFRFSSMRRMGDHVTFLPFVRLPTEACRLGM